MSAVMYPSFDGSKSQEADIAQVDGEVEVRVEEATAEVTAEQETEIRREAVEDKVESNTEVNEAGGGAMETSAEDEGVSNNEAESVQKVVEAEEVQNKAEDALESSKEDESVEKEAEGEVVQNKPDDQVEEGEAENELEENKLGDEAVNNECVEGPSEDCCVEAAGGDLGDLDTEAEAHSVKVLSEEAELQSCMPACLKAESVATPSSRLALVEAQSAEAAVDAPLAPTEEESTAQDNAAIHDIDKLASGEVVSKESTEEGKANADTSSESNNSSDQEKAANPASVRTFHVLAVPPQDLFFTAPPRCRAGQPVWIQGPHGPLMIRAPEGVKPGKRVGVRLAAPPEREVYVPAGVKPGDKISLVTEHNEHLEAMVPPGKKPGQSFPVYPPHTMLRVPEGGIPGDHLLFKIPKGFGPDGFTKTWHEQMAVVPENLQTGQYFAATIREPAEPSANPEVEVWI